MADTYAQTPRTTALRDRGRVSYERAAAHAILDEAYHCVVSFVVDGEPRSLPTLHVRLGDTLYLHGSAGSRPLLAAREETGLPVCVTVTHLDGLVLGRSQFHHSANYRSVVAHGTARLVCAPEEKRRMLTALVEKVATGRAADSRPPTEKELAQTAVLALPLTEVSVKARTGGVVDEPEDYALAHWAGVLPLRLMPGRPEPDTGLTVPAPAYLSSGRLGGGRSRWLDRPTLSGEHVILEPLEMSHVDGLFAAISDEAVWQFLVQVRPTDRTGMAALVAEALDQHDLGVRVPFVQRSAHTGEVVGTTSFYAVDDIYLSVAIGFTILGKPWWRTGVNTESKLMLMRYAFEELGSLRVEWHTDVRNDRSQHAIERLGAVREGILRRHRLRPDGTWRDSVLYAMTALEWPAARDRLIAPAAR